MKQNMMKTGISLALATTLVVGMVGCESNPFPAEGYVRETPAPQRAYMPAFALNIPTLDFVEGEESVYTLGATVPAEAGDPIVEIEGLPTGAVYDPAKLTITWKPGRADGNPKDGSDPSIGFARYTVKITLSATLDNLTNVSREETMTVVNSRMEPSITVSGNPRFSASTATGAPATMNEITLTIQSVDYPRGPFVVEATGVQGGVRIRRDPFDFTKIYVGYRPVAEDFSGITGLERVSNVSIRVYQPDGMVKQYQQPWTLVR